MTDKLPWQGNLLAVQPRIRLFRSFDEVSHGYLGFALRVQGKIGLADTEFLVGIGKAAQAKHGFRVGDEISGSSLPVADERMEPVAYYKTSALKVVRRVAADPPNPPPWHGEPPTLEVYRKRGHRRLAARTYDSKCPTCIWGCRMPVEITPDHWKPEVVQYRVETFCYGPKLCKLYRPGPKRRVPGRRETYVEEDWVEEHRTGHRGPDE